MAYISNNIFGQDLIELDDKDGKYTFIFTSGTLYWVSGLMGYILVSVTALTSAHILYMTEDFCGSLLGCAEYNFLMNYMSQ